MTHIPTQNQPLLYACYIPATWEFGVGGSQGLILLGLQSKFKASLDNMPRPFLQVVLGKEGVQEATAQ